MLANSNVLITGAAGFIGCNFVQLLLEHYPQIKVISLDKLTYAGNISNLDSVMDDPRHIFIQGDICNEIFINQILREFEVNLIVHFAAESHVDNSIESPRVFMETNVLGTFTLLDAAKNFWINEKKWTASKCRFHHISTDEVFGSLNVGDKVFSEENAYQPNSPYSASKAGSDHIVRAYFHTYQLPVTTSNCSNNFGPYQHREKLIPTVITACQKLSPIPVYGNGKNIRDWLYVEDHCEAIEAILLRGAVGEVYNIGGNRELENIVLIKTICQIMDEFFPANSKHEKLINFVSDRKGHDFRYGIDNRKIKEALNWSPTGNFKQQLIRTIQFYLNHNS